MSAPQPRQRRARLLVWLGTAALLGVLAAGGAPAADGVDQVLAELNARLGREQEAYASAAARARGEAVHELETLAHRAKAEGDAAAASEAWIAVLRLEREHAEAKAFFAGLGQLETVLKRIDASEAAAALLDAAGGVPPAAAGAAAPGAPPAAAAPEAPAGKPRHFTHAALIQQPWEVPFGGTVAITASRARELQFSGGGGLDTAGKIAILPFDLGTDWVLSGDCLHLGTACAGFIVAFDPATRAGTLWYAESDRAGAVNTIDGSARSRIAEAPLGCPLASWLPFSVTRKDAQVLIIVGDRRTVVTLPPGHQGGRFGLVTFYKETVIGLANLALTIHPR